ncbi:MAG: glutamate racemase [Campylobacterales bacterium]
MKAAVFDSGVGGLTVVKSLIAHQLFDEIIYYGDTARVPYGTKDPNTIVRYSLDALEFFNNFDVDILVVACNTVSAHALGELKAKAHHPVVGVIEPGVMALKKANLPADAHILVIGTQATVSSGSYQRLLQAEGYRHITAIATPLLVPLVEEGLTDGPIVQEAFKHYFSGLPKVDAVILGCTHYPMMSDALSKWFGGAKLVHSGDAIVEWLTLEGLSNRAARPTELKLFASENVHRLKKVAADWLDKDKT